MSEVAATTEAIPPSRTVLTSENSAEYYAKRLDLAPEPAAEPAKADDAAVESAKEEAAPAEKEADAQQTESDPEKKQRVNLRFSELSKQRDEARAEAQRERERAELAEKRAKELEAKHEPPAPEPADELGPEPKPEQFKDAFEYAKALAEYAAEKALHERDAKEAQERAQAEQKKVIDAFLERQKAFKAAKPDYEAKIAASQVAVSDEVREAILDSEVGPQLLYHFAEHPEDAERMKSMKTGPALRFLGKLEAKLVDAKAPDPAPKAEEPAKEVAAAATEISRAPAPITPLKGSGSATAADVPVDAKGEFYGTAAQWRALRKAGRIK